MIDPAGFWGLPTATVDWCEANYAVSPYVCEFFNTVSSLAMVVVGTFGLVTRRAQIERQVRIAFALLILVGLGSIAFHATLRFELQMLDELPMLYLVVWVVYLLVERGPEPRLGPWFPALLGGYAVVATATATLTRGTAQFYAFHVSFGALELFCLARVSWVAFQPENSRVRRLFSLGMCSYGLGVVVWYIDLSACRPLTTTFRSLGLPYPQLHAWWHVLVSVGFLLLLRVISVDRSRREGEVSGNEPVLTDHP